jgi:hypothetical protein
MAFSALKEISAAAAATNVNNLVRREYRNLNVNRRGTYTTRDHLTEISKAPEFLAALYNHNLISIDTNEINAYAEIGKKTKKEHQIASSKTGTDRDEPFIRLLEDHNLALQELNKAYANHEKFNKEYESLLVRAGRAQAANNKDEVADIQRQIVQTLEKRDAAENALFAAFEEVSNLGKTNQVSEANLSGAISALGSSISGSLTDPQKTELQKYRNSVTGLNNIDFNAADAADQVNNLLAKQKTNIDTLKAATSDGIWNLTCTTETSGEFTRSRIENRRNTEKDLKLQLDTNRALRDEIALEIARNQEEVSNLGTILKREKERTDGSLTDISAVDHKTKLKENDQILNWAGNILENSLLKELEFIEKELGSPITWTNVNPNLASRITNLVAKYNNEKSSLASTDLNSNGAKLTLTLGGTAITLVDLGLNTSSTVEQQWTALSGQRNNIKSAITSVAGAKNTNLENLIQVDSQKFEEIHNNYLTVNKNRNELIVEQEQITALGLDSLLNSAGSTGHLKTIGDSLAPFAPTGPPPAPHNITANDPQVKVLKDSLGALVDYVESLGAENISAAHRTQLESIRNRAQAIIDDNGVVNHAIVSTLLTEATKFVTDTRVRSTEIGNVDSSTPDSLIANANAHIISLDSLLNKNSHLRTAIENHNATKLREASLSVFKTALDAIDTAQTPADLVAIEAKLKGQLEADMEAKIKGAVNARLAEIKTTDGKDGTGLKGEKGDKGDGSGMPWYSWALDIASFAVGGFGLFSASQAKQSADDQKKKFEATMAQLDQRLGDLQQMTMGTAQSVNRINNGLQKATQEANKANTEIQRTRKRVNNIVKFQRRRKKQDARV